MQEEIKKIIEERNDWMERCRLHEQAQNKVMML